MTRLARTRPRASRWCATRPRRAGLTPRSAPYAVTRRIGDVTLEPVWPLPDSPTVGPGDGSTANNASVVLLAQDPRRHASSSAATSSPRVRPRWPRLLPGLHVDVLKVPHHGSRYQDLPFLQSLGPGWP